MAKPPPRSILQMIFGNFLKSFKPRQIRGTYVGEDYFGNKYYEIPPDPSIGKRKASRWFEPTDKEAFDQEITAEWNAWLRGIRKEPPTREELMQNLAIMDMKKTNAAKIDAKFSTKSKKDTEQIVTGMNFPSYNDYERVPGKGVDEKK